MRDISALKEELVNQSLQEGIMQDKNLDLAKMLYVANKDKFLKCVEDDFMRALREDSFYYRYMGVKCSNIYKVLCPNEEITDISMREIDKIILHEVAQSYTVKRLFKRVYVLFDASLVNMMVLWFICGLDFLCDICLGESAWYLE